MAPAGKADSITWARIWNACEAEISDLRSELKKGSDEYYFAVAERFNQVIDQTQVVDGILQRNQTMRSASDLTRMATSFMSEPVTSFSMLSSAVYDLRHAADTKTRQAAKKKLVRVAVSVAVADIVCAAVASLVDAMRDDDKEKDYWEKWIEAFLGITGDEEGFTDYAKAIFTGNLFSQINLLGKIPFAKDLQSLFEGYSISRMDMDAVTRFFNSAQTLLKALNGGGKLTLGNAFAGFFASFATLAGLPVSNVKRDLIGVVDTALSATGNWLLVYKAGKVVYSTTGNSAYFYDILYRAYKEDSGYYEKLYEAMIKDGFDPKKIRSAIESREKAAQGITSVSELESRYMSPAEQADYDAMARELAGNALWERATTEQQEQAEDLIYGLVTGAESAGVERIREKAEEGAALGITETEMILLGIALEMYDANNNGGYDMEETKNAIDSMAGLTQAEREYLFSITNRSKNNPYS